MLENIKNLTDQINKHDYMACMSDDPKVWERQQSESRRINNELRTLSPESIEIIIRGIRPELQGLAASEFGLYNKNAA